MIITKHVIKKYIRSYEQIKLNVAYRERFRTIVIIDM